MKTPVVLSIAAVALVASPAIAKKPTRIAMLTVATDTRVDARRGIESPDNEMNPWWRDYQTDLSEARRELASDLRRANDAGDRRDAYAEHEREVLDGNSDYQKEMVERGYPVGTVTYEPAD